MFGVGQLKSLKNKHIIINSQAYFEGRVEYWVLKLQLFVSDLVLLLYEVDVSLMYCS